VTTVANIQHPLWCDPDHCTAAPDGNGAHLSRPATIGPEPYTELTVRVQTLQLQPVKGYPRTGLPLVEIFCHRPPEDITDTAMEAGLILSVESAQALGRILAAVTDAAPVVETERVP
jgi:hypothetical protein